jgi:hypothetical protein
MARLKPVDNIEELQSSEDTKIIQYSPDPIDEYIVIVKDPKDWEEVHSYIIEENEIDGIPNRRIDCINNQEYSLRSAIYSMSLEESELLKTHSKIESVELNPEKYPQAPDLCIARWGKSVAFNKPALPAALDSETRTHTNGIRSNWSVLFANNASSEPFKGVGITSTTYHATDVEYSLSGKNVDAVIIDSGVGHIHPEFKNDDGTYRTKDLILDGPYKVDPTYFESNGYTYNKVIDGVSMGVGIDTTAAHAWWSNTSSRSPEFASLGTVTITSLYTMEHCSSKTTNSNSNQLIDGHGTACASQIGGKSFGLAFECNVWGIRISLGGVGGYLDASVALNACTIFHNAKKISQNADPDPTITNNSYGFTSSTGNTSGVQYTHQYRGQTLTYTGTGSDFSVPASGGACRNHKFFSFNSSGTASLTGYSGSGQYTPVQFGTTSDSAAENAIAAGVIVVSASGNQNQKMSDETDVDFDNWYSYSSNYINRVGGVQKGFSGSHTKTSGAIRVGALDCSVEPADAKQGSSPYSVRKVCYSNNGPMITVWAPGEMTMASGYTSSYEDYTREDDSNFYDTWFNGTSAATPNAVSLICLYLESNRKANQSDVIDWLYKYGTIEIPLSDPYGVNDPSYWSQNYSTTYDRASNVGDSYNVRGNGNLRGAPSRVIFNPYVNPIKPKVEGLSVSGLTITL